jgi:hypothetical protein
MMQPNSIVLLYAAICLAIPLCKCCTQSYKECTTDTFSTGDALAVNSLVGDGMDSFVAKSKRDTKWWSTTFVSSPLDAIKTSYNTKHQSQEAFLNAETDSKGVIPAGSPWDAVYFM